MKDEIGNVIYVTIHRIGKRTTEKRFCLKQGPNEYADYDEMARAEFRKYIRYLGKQGFVIVYASTKISYNRMGDMVTRYLFCVTPFFAVRELPVTSPGFQKTVWLEKCVWNDRQCGFGMKHACRDLP